MTLLRNIWKHLFSRNTDFATKAKPELVITARVQRAGSETWEDLGQIYKGKS